MSHEIEILDLSGSSEARRAFHRLMEGPDEAIDLALGALLIATEELESESFDAGSYLTELDRLAWRAQERIPPGAAPADRLTAIHEALFNEAGYAGDLSTYHRIENALLPRVMDRRRGLPITLAIVYVEVARRVGIDASGVGFPGHFLVRCEIDEGFVIVDPFHGGRVLDRRACVALLDQVTHGRLPFHSGLLDAATSREVLARVLVNLRRIHLRRGDSARALRAQDRLVLLQPERADVLRERAELWSSLDQIDAARADLERALSFSPFGAEATATRKVLGRLRGRRGAPN